MELGAVSDLVGYASAFSAPAPPGSSLRLAAPSLSFPALGYQSQSSVCHASLAYGAGGSTGLAQGHLPLPQRQLPPGAGPPLHPQSTIRAQTPPLDQLRPPGSSSPEAPPTILLTQMTANRSLRPQAAGCPGTLSKSCWLHVQNLPIFPPAPTFTSTSLG